MKRKGRNGKIVEYTQTPEIRDQTKAFSELAKLAKETPAATIAAGFGQFDPDGSPVRFTTTLKLGERTLGEMTLGEMTDDE